MSIQKIINKFRKDLKKKKPLVGGWMQISNSNLVELMCSSPYEWIAFDMEHGSFSIRDLPDLFRIFLTLFLYLKILCLLFF